MFGKAKSKAELQQLKDDYYANLQVEIENSSILEKRVRKPDEAPPVPPQYKTEAELIADVATLRNELVNLLMNELGYGYSTAQQALEGLNSDEIIKLVALFPSFKLTIAKDATKNRLRVLPPDFINSAMKNFIKKSSKSFGAEYSVGIPNTIDELEKMLPSSDSVNELIRFLSSTIEGVSIPDLLNQSSPTAFQTIINYLEKYVKAYPTFSQLKQLKMNIPSATRGDLARELGQAMVDYKLLTDNDVKEVRQIVKDTIEKRDANDIAQLGEVVASRLGGAYNSQIEQFKRTWDTTLQTAGGKNLPRLAEIINKPRPRINIAEAGEFDLDLIELLGDEASFWQGISSSSQPVRQEPNIRIQITEIANATEDEDTRARAEGLITDASVRPDLVQQALNQTLAEQGIQSLFDINEGEAENIIVATETKVKEELAKLGVDEEEEAEEDLMHSMFEANMGKTSTNPRARSVALRRIEERFRNQNVSLAVIDRYLDRIKQAIKDKYGADVDFPTYSGRQGVKPSKTEPINALSREVERLIDEFGYDPDEKALLPDEKIGRSMMEGFGKKPKKGFHKMPDGKIMKDSEHKMGKGMCGSGSRISVKKLVGKGIEVQSQPTYKTLGKYVMHYPHLMNNVFNVKYPSLGSIPSIKPKTISDDYKEFMIDIFETGKMNERLFNNLDDEEKTHFHKVCKGAGLLEMFKLKRGETDEEKEDLDRFNLLKGSYVAGNNSESVIRELRGLITKFIHEGRITKNEGLSMLMEIK